MTLGVQCIIKELFIYDMPKWYAWACMCRTYELHYGTWQASCAQRPIYFEEVRKQNSGTVVTWEHETHVHGDRLLKKVF